MKTDRTTNIILDLNEITTVPSAGGDLYTGNNNKKNENKSTLSRFMHGHA